MNQTMRIEPSSLEGKKALAVGYKIFDWNWGASGNYCYADENGEVEGSVHTVTGPLDKCGWGLHYSKNPIDSMRYRDLIQWNKFALVEAYDENIDCPDKGKSLCRTMKIVKVLSFDEMLGEIERVQKESLSAENGIRNGYGISDSSGVYMSKFCSKCDGISRCLFCYGVSGKLMIFNKPVTKERFEEVWDALGDWHPDFTNAEALKEKYGGTWEKTPAPQISGRSAKEAYAEMPEALRAYIKAMPEYDEDLFRAITEEN